MRSRPRTRNVNYSSTSFGRGASVCSVKKKKECVIASDVWKCRNKLASAVFRLTRALFLSAGQTSPKFSVCLMSAKNARTSRLSFSGSRRKMKEGSAVDPDLPRAPSSRRCYANPLANYLTLLLYLGPLGSKSLRAAVREPLLEDSSGGCEHGSMLASC